MNILVSGIAGDIGLGVGRILQARQTFGKIYGVDLHDRHPGKFVFDNCSIAPRATEELYLDWLETYCKTHNIACFIPTSEAEMTRLTAENLASIGNTKILLANSFVVTTALDKYACLNFLAANHIVVPAHGLVGKDKPSAYPVIVKPRWGQGSKNIFTIQNENDFNDLELTDYVWQDYLSSEDEEYTCPVYRAPLAGTRILVAKRKLERGITVSGEIIDNPLITEYVYAITQALDLCGCMNVQLRLTHEGPKLFEINPRLSSTLVFRDKMGFSDLTWWLADLYQQVIPDYIAPVAGTRFYLGAHEYICHAK